MRTGAGLALPLAHSLTSSLQDRLLAESQVTLSVAIAGPCEVKRWTWHQEVPTRVNLEQAAPGPTWGQQEVSLLGSGGQDKCVFSPETSVPDTKPARGQVLDKCLISLLSK